MRRPDRNAQALGPQGPAAATLKIDDLVLWITLGVILGGRLGYLFFYIYRLLNGTWRPRTTCSPTRWRSSSSGTAA